MNTQSGLSLHTDREYLLTSVFTHISIGGLKISVSGFLSPLLQNVVLFVVDDVFLPPVPDSPSSLLLQLQQSQAQKYPHRLSSEFQRKGIYAWQVIKLTCWLLLLADYYCYYSSIFQIHKSVGTSFLADYYSCYSPIFQIQRWPSTVIFFLFSNYEIKLN